MERNNKTPPIPGVHGPPGSNLVQMKAVTK